MEDGRKHIDDLFREGLEGYREMPEPAVWNAIEQRLPKQNGRKRFLWLWALLLLALLSSLGYYGFKNFFGAPKEHTAQEETTAESTGIHNEPATPIITTNKSIPDPVLSAKEHTTTQANKFADTSTYHTDKVIAASSATRQQEHVKENVEDYKDRKAAQSAGAPQKGRVTGSIAADKDGSTKPGNNDVTNNTKNKPQDLLTNEASSTPPKTASPSVATRQNVVAAERAIAEKTKANFPGSKTSNNSSPKIPDAEAKKTTEKSKNEPHHSITSLKEDKKEKPSATHTVEAKNSTATPSLQEPPLKASIATNKTTENANTPKPELKNDLLNKGAEKTKAAKTESRNSESFVKLQEDKKSGTRDMANNGSSIPKPPPGTITNTAKPLPVPTEKSTEKPIVVEGEKGKGNPVTVTGEKSSPKPILVSPAPNAKAAVIEESGKVSKATPLTIEAPKDYGIKVSKYETADDDEKDDETGSPASGGGGAGDGLSKNNKQRGGKKSAVNGGLKIGYDRGFANVTTSNLIGNAFLQWNISPKVALTLQPGIRYHAINKTQLFPQQSFHDVTNASLDSAHVVTIDSGTNQTLIQRNFIYRNTYDSINLSYKLDPQRYVEVELPLLLQYKLAENLSILLGGQLTFGKVIQIAGSTSRIQGLGKTDTVSYANVLISDTTPVNPPALTDYFSYNTPDLGSFDEGKYKNPVTNPARFGLMLGFSYEVRKRLLIDLMARKNISNLNFIPNENVRKIYSQPYFRITIGYKLF
ncbi:MAG TPA: hypothetical protein VL098_02420 [Flavipsychrobacter sp.]|nr:hypothetical protein [Flavipsychrobacter sp.]